MYQKYDNKLLPVDQYCNQYCAKNQESQNEITLEPLPHLGRWCFFCSKPIATPGICRVSRRCGACDVVITPASLQTRKPVCSACGSENLKVNLLGHSPHFAELRCADCDRWQKWVSRKALGGVA